MRVLLTLPGKCQQPIPDGQLVGNVRRQGQRDLRLPARAPWGTQQEGVIAEEHSRSWALVSVNIQVVHLLLLLHTLAEAAPSLPVGTFAASAGANPVGKAS